VRRVVVGEYDTPTAVGPGQDRFPQEAVPLNENHRRWLGREYVSFTRIVAISASTSRVGTATSREPYDRDIMLCSVARRDGPHRTGLSLSPYTVRLFIATEFLFA
jgi:hypothetical protein